jgi:phosphorylcholine metabolism protein LicD
MNKIYVKGTSVISSNESESHPIFIDVSKLHNVPDKKWKRSVQRKQIELLNLILAAQVDLVTPTSFLSKLTLGNLAKLPKKFWGKRLDKVLTRYDKKETEYVGILCNTLTCNPYTGRCGYETDWTKKAWHLPPRDILFEGHYFMTISDIESYLTYQFGPKWSEPYPEEKRKTKHNVATYFIDAEVRERIGL